jgi:hypothetical protein
MGGERFAPEDPGAIAHTSSAPASLTRPTDNKSKLNLRLPTTSAVGAGAMIFKSIVGAGLFGLPWAFQQMGIGGALIASLVIAGLTLYSGLVLVRVHDVVVRDTLKRDLTYVSLTEYCFGRTVGGVVYFLVIFTSIGSQGAYLIFIGSVLNSLWPVLSTQAYAGIVTVAMVPFVLLRDMSFLAVTSQLGNAGVAIVVATTVWRGAQMSTIGPPSAYVWFDPSNFMGAFGVIGFLYSCSTSLITRVAGRWQGCGTCSISWRGSVAPLTPRPPYHITPPLRVQHREGDGAAAQVCGCVLLDVHYDVRRVLRVRGGAWEGMGCVAATAWLCFRPCLAHVPHTSPQAPKPCYPPLYRR